MPFRSRRKASKLSTVVLVKQVNLAPAEGAGGVTKRGLKDRQSEGLSSDSPLFEGLSLTAFQALTELVRHEVLSVVLL